MHILEWHDFLAEKPQICALTVGVFDGVHRGHQLLLESVIRRGQLPTVLTFNTNPKKIFRSFSGDIYSVKRKLEIFETMGIQRTVLIDFSQTFRAMDGISFMHVLMDKGMQYLAIGNDFRCGYQQNIDAQTIQTVCEPCGCSVEIIQPLLSKGEIIHSSRIRNAILRSDFIEAEQLLGRPFILDLELFKEEKDGSFTLKKSGFLIPPDGAYMLPVYYGTQLKYAQLTIKENKIWIHSLNTNNCV
ncbi:MAG: FAD synthetase family protein [Treponema sp.]|jgi:FAD synthase|nr:FAD synthetase family protein [Treponema sp.]